MADAAALAQLRRRRIRRVCAGPLGLFDLSPHGRVAVTGRALGARSTYAVTGGRPRSARSRPVHDDLAEDGGVLDDL